MSFFDFDLNESGKAIKSSQPINGDEALPIANQIISILKEKYPNLNTSPLGSTGKKNKNQTSGDIDIAVELDFSEANNVAKFLKTKIQNLETNMLNGFRILSFGYPYNNKIVQCDLMFFNNINLAKYFYHSPDFTKNESNFKGSVRNMLMLNILKNIPVQNNPNTTFDNGHVKDLYKYSFQPENGLVIIHQSFEGKKGQEIKTKHTIKEDTKVVSTDTNYVTHFMMGENATDDTISSFEKMVDWMYSGQFPYKDKNEQIFKDFYEYMQRQEPENLSSVQSYINSKKNISEGVDQINQVSSDKMKEDIPTSLIWSKEMIIDFIRKNFQGREDWNEDMWNEDDLTPRYLYWIYTFPESLFTWEYEDDCFGYKKILLETERIELDETYEYENGPIIRVKGTPVEEKYEDYVNDHYIYWDEFKDSYFLTDEQKELVCNYLSKVKRKSINESVGNDLNNTNKNHLIDKSDTLVDENYLKQIIVKNYIDFAPNDIMFEYTLPEKIFIINSARRTLYPFRLVLANFNDDGIPVYQEDMSRYDILVYFTDNESNQPLEVRNFERMNSEQQKLIFKSVLEILRMNESVGNDLNNTTSDSLKNRSNSIPDDIELFLKKILKKFGDSTTNYDSYDYKYLYISSECGNKMPEIWESRNTKTGEIERAKVIPYKLILEDHSDEEDDDPEIEEFEFSNLYILYDYANLEDWEKYETISFPTDVVSFTEMTNKEQILILNDVIKDIERNDLMQIMNEGVDQLNNVNKGELIKKSEIPSMDLIVEQVFGRNENNKSDFRNEFIHTKVDLKTDCLSLKNAIKPGWGESFVEENAKIVKNAFVDIEGYDFETHSFETNVKVYLYKKNTNVLLLSYNVRFWIPLDYFTEKDLKKISKKILEKGNLKK